MLSQKFLNEIPKDLILGGKYIITSFFSFQILNSANRKLHDDYIEYYFLFESFLKGYGYEFTPIKISEIKTINIKYITDFFTEINAEFENLRTNDFISDTRNRFDIMFNNTFIYEFTQGDLDRVQELITELRDEITKSELFEEKHRQRLLRRLEKLQSELHKKVSDFDRYWGLIGDAGVVIGKFGSDVKPIVDRIKELVGIVWNTQVIAEELPIGTKIPFLTSGEEKKETDK